MRIGLHPRTRREFLAGLAGSALAPLEARTGIYNPQLATQTRIWLPLPQDLEPVFAGIRQAGYRRIDLAPEFLHPSRRGETLRLVSRHQLEIAAACAAGDRDEVLEIARAAKDAGARLLAVAAAAGAQPSAADLDARAYQVNQLGGDLGRLGLRLLLQHGPGEMRDNARSWRFLVRHTETALVALSVDADCAAQAGLDPTVLLDEFSPRLASVYLRSRRNGLPLEEIGDGDPDMARIAAALRRFSYEGYLVVDLASDPQTRRQTLPMALSHTRWYMQEIFGTRPGGRPVDMGPHVRTQRF
jgi:sugar phosphate isomerase/epimerase